MYLKILNEESNSLPITIKSKLYIIPFRNQCSGISNKITLFEEQIGFTLPNDYKKFLLKYNGGVCDNALYNLEGKHDYLIEESISPIFGFDTHYINPNGFDITSDLIKEYNNIYSGEFDIPTDINGLKYIAIANVYSGDRFCLGEDNKIYYWSHDDYYDGKSTKGFMIIENNFKKFIDNCYYKFENEIDMRDYFTTPRLEEVII